MSATMYPPQVDVFGVDISVTDYDEAVSLIVDAGRERRSMGVSALATHGLMEAVHDDEFLDTVNRLDIVTPDGQPVRWAANLLHDADMHDRVYGPDLTWLVCGAAADAGVPVYLFGSTSETCDAFVDALRRQWPHILIAGVQPDRFREATPDEDQADIDRINESGAGIVLVGRGCPRQERWVEAHMGQIDAAMLAVGAAFDYHAGHLRKPPAFMQRVGLEWLWRLALEPKRLFRRYAVTNTQYIIALSAALAARAKTKLTGGAREGASHG